jgi:hypothetical protein
MDRFDTLPAATKQRKKRAAGCRFQTVEFYSKSAKKTTRTRRRNERDSTGFPADFCICGPTETRDFVHQNGLAFLPLFGCRIPGSAVHRLVVQNDIEYSREMHEKCGDRFRPFSIEGLVSRELTAGDEVANR